MKCYFFYFSTFFTFFFLFSFFSGIDPTETSNGQISCIQFTPQLPCFSPPVPPPLCRLRPRSPIK